MSRFRPCRRAEERKTREDTFAARDQQWTSKELRMASPTPLRVRKAQANVLAGRHLAPFAAGPPCPLPAALAEVTEVARGMSCKKGSR